MNRSKPSRPGIQVVGGQDPPVPDSGSRALQTGLIVGLILVVLGGLATARWIARPSDEERAVRSFAAAVDEGKSAAARDRIQDPTILMWPTYWSFLNIEHISPFGDRLEEFIEYQHALGTRTEIGECTARAAGPGEPTDHDTWLRCGYTLRDAISERLEGPSGATTGQLSVGLKDGWIRTVFVIRSDQPAVLNDFRTWISSTYPDRYFDLLAEPAVLQLDVPIIGLFVTDYNGHTAATLTEFADAYVAAGFPSR